MRGRSGVCLATATTDGYLPGTAALIGSFLHRHPTFDGDVAIIEHQLAPGSKAPLQAAFPKAKFLAVGPALARAVERLQAELPHLRVNASRFACLEAFRLAGYRKVLYCDSDLLFRAPVADLLAADGALICCGDSSVANGQQLDAETYRPIDPKRAEAEDGPRSLLRDPFNTGMMLIDGELGGERTYGELLALMEGKHWPRLVPELRLADQFLNRYFRGRQTLVSWTYNYLLPHAEDIQAREGLAAADAKVLHFTGPIKPWLPASAMRWARGGGEGYMTAAFKHWYDAYMDTLIGAALRNSRFERSPA